MVRRYFWIALLGFVVGWAAMAMAAQPPQYTRQADFSDHTQNYPSVPQDGTDLDNEFNAVKVTLDALRTNIGLIQRDDGALANRSVGLDQLSPELLALLGSSDLWATSTAYSVGDTVFVENGVYECEIAHTSGTFSTDLAAGKWSVVLDYGANVLRADSVSSVAIGTGSKSFTVAAGKYFKTSNYVVISSAAAPATNWMYGQVTSYSGTTLTVNVFTTGGSGTYADWSIEISGARGPAGPAGTVDIDSLSVLSDISGSNDQMIVYDSSAAENKKISPDSFFAVIGGMSAATAADGDDDSLVIYDSSGSLAKRIVLNDIYTAIPDLTEQTAVEPNEDYVVIYDADAAAGRKAKIENISGYIVGVSYEWNGPFAPAGTVFEFGQAISRTTYSALMDAITAQVTGDTTNGNSTITNVSIDLRGLGLEGAAIEGSNGIPSGRTIVSVTETTIVMSGTADATDTDVDIVIFPHGNGDGSTTFNVPDSRGRVFAGRDNMGGTSANRLTGLTNGIDGDVLARTGGSQSHTLLTAELPAHTHAAGTLATGSSGAHTHTIRVNNFGGVNAFLNTQTTVGSTPIPTSSDGAHTHTITGSVASAGSGAAHNIVQPSIVKNKVIGTGVF